MKKVIFILVILTLFLVSCTSSGPVYGRNRLSYTQVDYFTGKQGLEINFLEQAPPEEVFEGAPLDVQLLIENKGAFDITENYRATFQVTFDSLEMLKQVGNSGSVIAPESTTLQIHGKSTNYPQGEILYLFSEDNLNHPFQLTFNAKPIVANFEKNTASFYVTACYPYKTYFSDDVCIDTDPQNIDPRRKVCTAEDKSYSKGQGAPVAITAIETNMVPKGTYVLPQFVIHVDHYGDGIVSDFATTTEGTCSELTTNTINTFQIDARLGNDTLVCYPEVLRFRDGEAEAVCKLETNSIDLTSANYLASLSVELSYLYTQTVSKDIVVKRTRPLNLFEETAVNEDFCHKWEEFIPGGTNGGECVSKCEYHARQFNAEPFRQIAVDDDVNNFRSHEWPILQQGITAKELSTAWASLDCVYGSETLCRQNPASCIFSRDLCQPGTFCGWPSCFERNQKPFVEYPQLSDSFLSWSCRDGDDNPMADPQQTCGCDSVAYWTLVENRNFQTLVGENKAPRCENLPPFKYTEHPVEGTYNPTYKTMDFRVSPPLFDSTTTSICLKVVDKQGNAGFARFNGQNI